MEGPGGQSMSDVAELLDQCSPEELGDILRALEGGGLSSLQSPRAQAQAPAPPAQAKPLAPQAPPGQPRSPVPPTRPPPPGGASRRPAPVTVKKAEGGGPGSSGTAAKSAGDGPAPGSQPQITMAEIKRALEQHSASVVAQVERMLPAPEGAADILDLSTLTKTLAERDNEVKSLEATLSGLQAELAEKDRRVAELGGELDRTVREVRHKQLDLEFQQLKLEERVRCNAELEQTQRKLTERVEEANLSARHAALDVEMCLATPRTLRAQGTLPWTVRKNRLPAMGGMTPR